MQEKKTDKMPCSTGPKPESKIRGKYQEPNPQKQTCPPGRIKFKIQTLESETNDNHKSQTINYKLMLVVLMFFL